MSNLLPHFSWAARKTKLQKYATVPCITDPTSGVKRAEDDNSAPLAFAQREEANPMELFFDLFFVANLALFTQYHIIIEHAGFLGYIEFFGLLWGTWFSITLFDVRFASDSIYERICKIVHCSVFVVLALVGSRFEPGANQTYGNSATPSNDTFRTLSIALATSRAILTIQYFVVAGFCAKRGVKNVIFPLGLNAAFYCITAIAFGLMSLAFRRTPFLTNVYVVWYVIMGVEVVCVLSVSTIWRDLSFKLTHLVERMSLLTLIVIGEGILGIGKTISIILRTSSDAEYYGLTLIVLLIIFLLYMIYFDNTPRGHFGTIRQQIWALLHFPLHLSIIGIVEGVQQLLRGRYWQRSLEAFLDTFIYYCIGQNLDGPTLSENLRTAIDKFHFEDKAISLPYIRLLDIQLSRIYNDTTICNAPEIRNLHPNPKVDDFLITIEAQGGPLWNLTYLTQQAIYGTTIVDNSYPNDKQAGSLSRDQWTTPYNYFWGSMALFAFITHVLISLRRKTRGDFFLFMQTTARICVLVVAISLGVIGALDDNFYYTFAGSSAIAPTSMACLLVIFISDHAGKFLSNWHLRKHKYDLAVVDEEEAEAEQTSGEHLKASRANPTESDNTSDD